MTLRQEIDAFWQRFLFASGLPKTVTWQDCFHFETSPERAQRALEQVAAGVKQATVTSLEAFQRLGLRPPKRGDLSIVTTFAGVPRCVIQTQGVIIRPYNQVGAELALLEGEDDTLEGWRIRTRNFLIAEGQTLGYTFSPEQALVFETFRAVYEDRPLRGGPQGMPAWGEERL